jgi:hypothetical protein
MNQLLCEAIKQKRIVTFYYKGLFRIVEPYTYGVHKDTGNEVLSAYQIGGHSSSGKSPYWRLFIVPQMSNINLTGDSFFKMRNGYEMNDSRMSTIYCQVL